MTEPLKIFEPENSVEFVLVWNSKKDDSCTEESFEKRRIFETNLELEGLELDYELEERNWLNFVKIHAPQEVLTRYCDILKLRMPMREDLCELPKDSKLNILDNNHQSQSINNFFETIRNYWTQITEYIFVPTKKFPEINQHRCTAIYSREREYLFNTNSPHFFTPAIRSRILQFILDRVRFSEDPNRKLAFGIDRLIHEKAYEAAYPLHDGDVSTKGSTRNLLFTEWSSYRKWFKYQPIDCLKEYFGIKIALYFAWLGFYTSILFAPAIVGLACFIYSVLTMDTSKPSNDICELDIGEKMCPLCDDWCDYWDLKETCFHAKFTYLIDNPTTVFFAIFMSIWATTFLEMWKRYSAEITHRWDLTGFTMKEEHPRPQYLAKLSHIRKMSINHVTNTAEPQVSFWKTKLPIRILSVSIVIFMILVAFATVFGVVLYRMTSRVFLKVYSHKITSGAAIIFSSGTAALLNLIIILIFDKIFCTIAERWTEKELWRTQQEFDDSLTLKIYSLQFVNHYASIFYVAFYKGNFVGSPTSYIRIFGFRQEECGPGGCLLDLCIQLAVVMVGQQALHAAVAMTFPIMIKLYNYIRIRKGLIEDDNEKTPQWVKDFLLVKWGSRSLFPEYLQMVIQYGFVTIFVAAFPLAPLFALLNNIIVVRSDAKRMITIFRRPVPQRVSDIGVWFDILDSVGKLSVITNGCIIAFTSDFVPRLVYTLSVSPDGSLEGYIQTSLSYFNTSDFKPGYEPRNFNSESVCRYPDYRTSPWSSGKYEPTTLYWHVFAARLIFLIIFENLVVLIQIFVKWAIPDIPHKLKDRIRREAYITNEIIIKEETARAQQLPSSSRRSRRHQ